jgi:hypothetical protein
MLVFHQADKLYQERFSFIFKDIANQGSRRSRREYRFEHFGTIIHETLKSLYDPL